MTETEAIAGLGIFFGCFARTMLPFLKKKSGAAKAGENVRWENRYIWTLIFNLAVAMITTMMLLPTFAVPAQSIFPAAFFFAWGSQDLINKVAT